MAEEIVTLPAVLDTPEGRDVVREMLAEMARLTMEREAEGRRGAGYGARSEGRRNHRDGYRDRLWDARAGSVRCEGQVAGLALEEGGVAGEETRLDAGDVEGAEYPGTVEGHFFSFR